MTYAELDLQDLKRINERLASRKKIVDIDKFTILATFGGHTIFSIYHEEI